VRKLSIAVCALAMAAGSGSAHAAEVSITGNGGAITQYIFRYTDDFDEDLAFKVDSNGNPTEDTFFYAGIVKTFDLFSN
jgi:hypothetical protein